jgi:hypothetical protein
MSEATPAWEAIRLLRAARVATLASVAQGHPYASLVTPACSPDRSLLLLLSDLSEHTRHLRDDPRCSVLVAGATESANPQTTPRVTITGLAERLDDPALKARYLAVHPYAAMYAEFTDFAVWRIVPKGGLYVGGFGRAARLRAAQLAPDETAVSAIAAEEADLIAQCNAALPEDRRVVAIDLDGCDVAAGERVIRLSWTAPLADPHAVREELAHLPQSLSREAGPGQGRMLGA